MDKNEAMAVVCVGWFALVAFIIYAVVKWDASGWWILIPLLYTPSNK